VVALGLSAAFLLGTLAFDFVNNPGHLTSAGEIFASSLTTRQVGGESTPSYGALMIFVFTWVLYGVIGLGELDREGVFDVQRDRRWPKAIAVYAGVSLVGFLIFGGFIAGHQASLTRTQVTTVEELVDVGVSLAGLLGRYYGLIFTVLVLMGFVLTQEERHPRSSGSVAGYAVLVIFMLVSVVAIQNGSYNLIRADVIFKQGKTFANGRSVNEKQIGIQHYERAIDYAPREDYYYLFLGKAYLELAQGLPEDTPREQREAVFFETEEILTRARVLNPLNTDHSANLARFYKSWAARVAIQLQSDTLSEPERTALQQQRQELLALSLENYDEALTLSPNNPILWNELAQLYVIDLGDQEKYEETIQASLDLDEKFEQTWILIGDIRTSQNDLGGALEAYTQALDIRNDCAVRRAIGRILVQQSEWEAATDSLETSIVECDRSGILWELYHLIAIAYANQGRMTQAMQAAETALMLAPEAQKPTIQEVIDQLEARGQPQPAVAP
jgi:tetratricopeptide (TPR) repeat protein